MSRKSLLLVATTSAVQRVPILLQDSLIYSELSDVELARSTFWHVHGCSGSRISTADRRHCLPFSWWYLNFFIHQPRLHGLRRCSAGRWKSRSGPDGEDPLGLPAMLCWQATNRPASHGVARGLYHDVLSSRATWPTHTPSTERLASFLFCPLTEPRLFRRSANFARTISPNSTIARLHFRPVARS